jgi:trk system potassium uptake protein TrkA
MQGDFLGKIGADEVIHAEKEAANRLAACYGAGNIFGCTMLSQDYAVAETPVPREWFGHNVNELAAKARYSVNILGFKGKDKQFVPHMGADHIFREDEHILLAGYKKDIADIAARTY